MRLILKISCGQLVREDDCSHLTGQGSPRSVKSNNCILKGSSSTPGVNDLFGQKLEQSEYFQVGLLEHNQEQQEMYRSPGGLLTGWPSGGISAGFSQKQMIIFGY